MLLDRAAEHLLQIHQSADSVANYLRVFAQIISVEGMMRLKDSLAKSEAAVIEYNYASNPNWANADPENDPHIDELNDAVHHDLVGSQQEL